jgi:hypothetical protein
MTYAVGQGPQVTLPVVSPALEPASVRNGSASVKRAYAEGLAFEEMLTEELTRSLAEGTGLGEEGSEGAAAQGAGQESEAGSGSGGGANSEISSLLPHALSEGLISHGALGLATQFADEAAARESAAGHSATASGAPAPGSSPIGGAGATAGGSAATSGGTGATTGGVA